MERPAGLPVVVILVRACRGSISGEVDTLGDGLCKIEDGELVVTEVDGAGLSPPASSSA